MGTFQPIQGLVIDARSADALKRIKQKLGMGNALASTLSLGVISSIFTKSSAGNAAYNISQTDWGLYAQSMRAIPSLTKGGVRQIMHEMILYYQFNYDNNHLNFWIGLHDGCKSL